MQEQNVASDVLLSAQIIEGEKLGEDPATASQHSSGNLRNNEVSEEEYKYITGLKLAVVIVSVTLVVSLMLLDVSIIATVVEPVS